MSDDLPPDGHPTDDRTGDHATDDRAGAPDADRVDELVRAAVAARERSYSPYSGFRMGAAVATVGGDIVTGAIVENVSLGLAMCAERVALFASVAAGHRPVALAVVAPRTSGRVTTPCGACLQVALELGGPELVVLSTPPKGPVERSTVGELLPRGPHKPD